MKESAPKQRKLTRKQEKFVQALIETNNASEAARQAHYGNTPGSTRAIASETLSNPNVQERIEELRSIMVQDSYYLYGRQKEIFHKVSASNEELANKIINKVIDRAGLTPIYRAESKHITAKFNFRRGDSTPQINSSPEGK